MQSAWLSRALNDIWYPQQVQSLPLKTAIATALLKPLSSLVAAAARRRRTKRVLNRQQTPPIVVVGNMVVGGGGKTPLIVHLCEALQQLGYHPAVLAHGYGANVQQASRVLAESDPKRYGDEAVMLAGQTNARVYVGPTRLDTYALIQHEGQQPESPIDIVLCDDGLQHWPLPRAFEIACFDSRGMGNGLVLPAGPLREPSACIRTVDAVVAAGRSPVDHANIFTVQTKSLQVRHIAEQGPYEPLAQWAKDRGAIHAVAGIANPNNFFQQLDAFGLTHIDHALADHAWPTEQIVSELKAQCVLMTEKDAVKWRQVLRLSGGNEAAQKPNWFTLKIERETTPNLAEFITRTLYESKTH